MENTEAIKLTEKDPKKGRGWLALGVSLAVNLAILIAVFHFTDLYYETNDDFAIAERIANGYPYIGFVSYYLCKVLIYIQNIFTGVNIFMLSQIVMSFLAFTAVLKVMFDRCESIGQALLSVAAVAVFSLDHYCALQFTKTAALLMAAGLLLLVDTYTHKRTVIGFAAAFALFYIGVAYRQKGMFPALAFAGLFMLIWWLVNRKEFFTKERKWVGEIALVLLIGVLALVPYGLDLKSDAVNRSTPELKTARDYQDQRIKVTDYPAYEFYDDNSKAYDDAGLSRNDVYMLDRWIFDYDGGASYDNLVKVNEINYPQAIQGRSWTKAVKRFLSKTYKGVLKRSFTGMHIILLLLVCICMIAATRPREWLYILGIGLLTVAIYVVIYYMQREQYRAFYVADISATFFLLYALADSKGNSIKGGKAIRGIVCLCAAALACVLILPPAVTSLGEDTEYVKRIIESDAVAEYFDEHQDTFFIGATTTMKVHKSYLDPLSIPSPEINVADTGGWETMTPYKLDQLERYGVTNPVRDLIDNEKVLYFGGSFRDVLTEYYNKWYGSEGTQIRFVKVDEVDGNGIYRVITEKN